MAPQSPAEIVIIDAVRTPVGRFRCSLAAVRADHLGAGLLQALVERNGIRPEQVDDVIFGCVTQIGEQSANVARTALLSAGWPDSVPGLTIDRKCGSSEVSVHVAAGFLATGMCDLVVAGGVESMSRVPMGSNRAIHGEAFGWLINEHRALPSQGEASERIADKWKLTREQLDAFAVRSHARAAAATASGAFANEIVPVDIAAFAERDAELAVTRLEADETIRPDSNVAKLATLEPAFRPDGRITAGNSSQISDGAAALLLTRRNHAEALGLKPRARVVAFASVGADPELVLTGPIPATRRVLERAGLALSDIDLFEVNEAFASVPLAWLAEMGVDPDRLNVNGGAIALGHPLGASGARLMTSLLNALEQRGGRYGLQTMCCNGGLATATIIERLD
jgi:acetyl-CoA acetyltransferase family protein